jgi:hypothetical protein
MEKKDRGRFEQWRDRAFSILIPLLFGYLLLFERNATTEVKILTMVLLAGFATGQAAALVKRLANAVAVSIVQVTGQKPENDEQDTDQDKSTNP